ncbi:MAG: TIGR01777 family protein [Desulfobulbaceae bacterium]|nr:TIGR01777 family protein [Desulfobulbaceae bacterium]
MRKPTNPALFEHLSEYPCSAEELYNWHSRPGALERLLPPWENIAVLARKGGIEPGGMVKLKMHAGPFSYRFLARHIDDIPGKMFRDIQERGPFASWSHTHKFRSKGEGSLLQDQIEYSLPGHRFLPHFVKNQVEKRLANIFSHRQRLLSEDIALHQRSSVPPLRILVTGASGVIGRDLLPLLTTGGHQVFTLVRRRPDPGKREIYWDPANGILNESDLPELDGIIHLAGEYIGLSRWKEEKKRRVIDSRIKGTKLLARTLSAQQRIPKVFLCASAVGYYGDGGDKIIDETNPPGDDFISEVCRVWEKGTEQARDAGIRTVFMRLGIGLTPQGGALKHILKASPFGFIRRFGAGNQYISWISRDDMVSAMLHALSCHTLEGPVNIAAPEPVTNAEFMQTLARISGRPLLFPLPGWFLKMIYGQMASEILLSGCRVSATKLQDSGFRFRHPSLEMALKNLLGLGLAK